MHPRKNIILSWKSLSWKALITVLLTAAVAAPVLAAYLGPDRVRTTYDTETFSYGDWVRQDNTPGNTMCDHSLTGSDYCVICSWERDPYTASCANEQPGDFYYTLGTRTETVAHTTTYPPATISASLSGCTLVNGWCASPSSLVLTGSEPVSGYTILAIEGTINGGSFGCSGATCTVPLSEGANAFTYWAFSDWGDTSEMGSTSQGQDTQPPTISGEVNGTTGDNGWYITNAVVSASAVDAVSGASLTFSLDGASPAAYTGALTLTDGVHTVVFSAVDGAGHTASASAAANVDTTLPSASFTSPAAGWLNGTVTVSGTAGDATSGLAQVQLSLDGGSTWQSMGSGSPWGTGWDTTSAGDGTHTLQVYSVDQAGNSLSPVSVTVNVDNTPPQLSLSAPGAFCAECGESIDLTYSVQDTGVGVASWQISVDGTPLISGAAGAGSTFSWDGSGLGTGDHSLVFTGVDGLGNSDSISVTVRLEAEPPAVPPVVIINTSRTATPTPTATQTSLPFPHPQITLGGAKFAREGTGGLGPTPTTNSGAVTFGSVETGGEAAPQAEGSPNLLWGLGALGLIGAVTAAVLEERRKRKEEEARQLAEAQAKAAALNAAEEQKRIQNWMNGQTVVNQETESNPEQQNNKKLIHGKVTSVKNTLSDKVTPPFSGSGKNFFSENHTPTEWELSTGISIAQNGLQMFNNNTSYYIWDADPNEHAETEDMGNVPGLDCLFQREGCQTYLAGLGIDYLGGRIPIVCADLPSLAYRSAGIDFWALPSTDVNQLNWFGQYGWDNDFGPRLVSALYWMIDYFGTLHTLADGDLPEVGDIVMSPTRSHAGLIVYVGDDISSTLIEQTSTTQGRITIMPLDLWAEAMCPQNVPDPCNPLDVSFGHPELGN